MPKRERSTVDQVYKWAAENGIPAPDAFAVRYRGLGGKEIRLKLAAALWKRQVAAGKTGFPLIDEK